MLYSNHSGLPHCVLSNESIEKAKAVRPDMVQAVEDYINNSNITKQEFVRLFTARDLLTPHIEGKENKELADFLIKSYSSIVINRTRVLADVFKEAYLYFDVPYDWNSDTEEYEDEVKFEIPPNDYNALREALNELSDELYSDDINHFRFVFLDEQTEDKTEIEFNVYDPASLEYLYSFHTEEGIRGEYGEVNNYMLRNILTSDVSKYGYLVYNVIMTSHLADILGKDYEDIDKAYSSSDEVYVSCLHSPTTEKPRVSIMNMIMTYSEGSILNAALNDKNPQSIIGFNQLSELRHYGYSPTVETIESLSNSSYLSSRTSPYYTVTKAALNRSRTSIILDCKITYGEITQNKVICLSELEILKVPYVHYVRTYLDMLLLRDQGHNVFKFDSSTTDCIAGYNTAAYALNVDTNNQSSVFYSTIAVSTPSVSYLVSDFQEVFTEHSIVDYDLFLTTDYHKVITGLIKNSVSYLSVTTKTAVQDLVYIKSLSSTSGKRFMSKLKSYLSHIGGDGNSTRVSIRSFSNHSINIDSDRLYPNYKTGIVIMCDDAGSVSDLLTPVVYPILKDNVVDVTSINVYYDEDVIIYVSPDMPVSEFMEYDTISSSDQKAIKDIELLRVKSATDNIMSSIVRHMSPNNYCNIRDITPIFNRGIPVYTSMMGNDPVLSYLGYNNSVRDLEVKLDSSAARMLHYIYELSFKQNAITTRYNRVPHAYNFIQMWNQVSPDCPRRLLYKDKVVKTDSPNKLRSGMLLYNLISSTRQDLVQSVKSITKDYLDVRNGIISYARQSINKEGNYLDTVYDVVKDSCGIEKCVEYSDFTVFQTSPLYVESHEFAGQYYMLGRYLILISNQDLHLDNVPQNYYIVPLDFRLPNNAGLHMDKFGKQCMGNLAELFCDASDLIDFFNILIKSIKSYNVSDPWGIGIVRSYLTISKKNLSRLLKNDPSLLLEDNVFGLIEDYNESSKPPLMVLNYNYESNIALQDLKSHRDSAVASHSIEDYKKLLISSIEDFNSNQYTDEQFPLFLDSVNRRLLNKSYELNFGGFTGSIHNVFNNLSSYTLDQGVDRTGSDMASKMRSDLRHQKEYLKELSAHVVLKFL